MKRSDKTYCYTQEIAMRLVDIFVKEGLCPDCTDTNNSTEFDFQDIIYDELIKLKIMPYKKAELRWFVNSLPEENMKWKKKLDDVLYEKTIREHNEYMLDFNKEQKEKNRILYMRRKF